MNTLAVWWDAAADGPENMAADECLAAEAERQGRLLMRFYGWSRTTISLGGFQPVAEPRQMDCLRGLPLVRRPSGGGAIVHGSDLTYAAAVPKHHPWGRSPQIFYDALHEAMAEVLADHAIRAWRYAAPEAVGRPSDAGSRFFCFDRRSPGDLVMARPVPLAATAVQGAVDADVKIMGSAQRRLAGAVLQHGSLLLEGNPDVSGPARHSAVADLVPRGAAVSASELAAAWVGRLADGLGGVVRDDGGSFIDRHAQQIAGLSGRFREERWTGRR